MVLKDIGCFEVFWAVLGSFGWFWAVLGCFWRFLAFGDMWPNVNTSSITLWAVLGGFELVWAVLDIARLVDKFQQQFNHSLDGFGEF